MLVTFLVVAIPCAYFIGYRCGLGANTAKLVRLANDLDEHRSKLAAALDRAKR